MILSGKRIPLFSPMVFSSWLPGAIQGSACRGALGKLLIPVVLQQLSRQRGQIACAGSKQGDLKLRIERVEPLYVGRRVTMREPDIHILFFWVYVYSHRQNPLCHSLPQSFPE